MNIILENKSRVFLKTKKPLDIAPFLCNYIYPVEKANVVWFNNDGFEFYQIWAIVGGFILQIEDNYYDNP